MKKLLLTVLLTMTALSVSAQQLPTHERLHNAEVQIEHNKQSITYLSKQNNTNKADIKHLNTQLNNMANREDIECVSTDTKKGISTAIAIASLEYPEYNSDKKLSLAVATGTYKGKTSIAYGVAYRPNYDMIFSIKCSDNSVGASVGVNL